MAIQMNLAYSKKLGLPRYSSHSFSVSIVTEVTNAEDIPGEVDRAYGILQQAVDAQIVEPGYVPGGDARTTPGPTNGNHDHAGDNGSSGGNGNGQHWNCSEKQQSLIERLVNENPIDWETVEALARERFGGDVHQLNKLQASGLIDEMFDRTGGRRKGKGNGQGGRNGNGRQAHAGRSQ